MASEPYNLRFQQRPDYLRVHLKAPFIDLDIAVSYINKLMAHLRENLDKRVLFIRETPAPTRRRHYAMVASVIANMLPVGVSFAVVDLSTSYKIVKECVVKENENKHGNISAFDSVEDAEAWLLEQ